MGRNRPFSGQRPCWERCFASDWCSRHGRSRKRRMPCAFRWRPHSGAFRTDTAGGRTLLPGKRTFHKGIDLACAEGTGSACCVQGGAVVRRHTAAQAMAPVCVLLHTDGTASHFMPICSTPMSARARWWKQGRLLGAAGQQRARYREHTCILNCTGREQPVTRRMRWAFPHEAA